ncbi:MAG: hypothetical protein ACTHMD_16870 [Flavisolibacter sp.]
MKYIAVLLLFIFVIEAHAQENYTIQIGDKEYSMALDSVYQVILQGKKINLSLKQKDVIAFKDSAFSFSYLKGYLVSEAPIENAGMQYAILDAGGSGFLVQKYWTLNPVMMKEILLQEVTKESKGYGFTEKREEYQRKLKSGQTVSILKSTLTYKDETNVYEVAALGGKDEGLVIMTLNMGGLAAEKGSKLTKLLWDSIEYHR